MPGSVVALTDKAPRLRLSSRAGSIVLGATPGHGAIVALTAKAPKLRLHFPAVEVDQSTAVLNPAARLKFRVGTPNMVNLADANVLDGCLFLTSFDGTEDFLFGFRPKVWSVADSAWVPVRVEVWSVSQRKWVLTPWQTQATFLG